MVIGAGALGLSTALHCALAGRSVVVVERHTAGSQASGRAAGLFKSVQADELRTRLARRSITRALTFADWAECRWRWPAREASWSPGPVSTASTCAGSWRSPGAGAPTSARLRGPRSATTGQPGTTSRCGPGGRLHRAAGQPYPGLPGGLPAARGHGGRERAGHRDTGHRGPGGRRRDRGRSIAAPVVVDAAGGWVTQVARLAGARVPVAPVRHQLLITEPRGARRPGRRDRAGGRCRRLPAPGPWRAHGRRVRVRPAAGRPGAAGGRVHHR